ncbi:MAG: urease accessory protein UreE [Peptococcaceae bacterium]|nr:urease accessory protein UreE [Peptococcaceae bacterium]
MILDKVIGNINDGLLFPVKKVEVVELSWEEMGKRRLRKRTASGRDVGIVRTAKEPFKDGDILCVEEDAVIVLRLRETEVLVVEPRDMKEMGTVCYQLGNRHLPVMILDESVVCPCDQTLIPMLEKLGVKYHRDKRRFEQDERPGTSHSSRHQHGHG